MQTERSADAMTDEPIAREIESALAVEPSPGFVAGVRARIAAEPAPVSWWLSWKLATAAAVVVAAGVVLMVTWPAPASDPTASGRPVVDAGLPTHVPPAPRAELPAAAPPVQIVREWSAPRAPIAPRTTGRPEAPADQPIVLIPAAERALLRRLLRSGIVDQLEPVLEPLVIAEPAEMRATGDEITISPIAIEPMAPVVPPQGEGQ